MVNATLALVVKLVETKSGGLEKRCGIGEVGLEGCLRKVRDNEARIYISWRVPRLYIHERLGNGSVSCNLHTRLERFHLGIWGGQASSCNTKAV